MTVRTISPSGDPSGVTDTATVAAAMALMGAGDELVSVGGQWYFLPTGNGYFYTVSANNQTYTFGSSGNQFRARIVGPGAATTTLGFISITGKTGITIRGAQGYRAYFDGNRPATKNNCTVAGQGLVIANQAVWGSDNAIVLTDLEFVDPPGPQHFQIQSCQGGTGTRLYTSATVAAVAAGHGNDFDAVAQDKPTRDWTFTDCDLDSYGNEALKHENSINITHTRPIFRNTVTLTQDNADPFSELGPIVFTDPTFYGPVTMSYLKHKGVTGGSLPTTTLSLTSAAINLTANSITCTAGVATFAAGDVGKYIAQKGTSGALGLFLIQTFTDTTHVTGINIQAWSSTGPHASQAWSLGEVDQSGSGAITFTRPILIGDGAVLWGPDQVASNYGTITLTGGSAVDDDGVSGGSNFLVLPAGVAPVITGNPTGMRGNVLHYIRPAKPGKAPAGPAATLSLTQSFASSWTPQTNIWTLLLAANASSGDEWVIMDGTYFCVAADSTHVTTETVSYDTGNKTTIGFNGQSVTLRAKHKWKAIVDGTGTTATNWILDTNSPPGAKLRGIKVQNFTASGNNSGVNLQGTSSVQVSDMWFYTMSTANGGPGIRSTSTGSPSFVSCLFTLCTCTGATGGGGLYSSSVNARYERLYADTCTTSVQGGGFARFDFASVARYPIVGIVAVGCSATGTANGGAVMAKNCTIAHMSAANNTSAAGTPGADVFAAAGTVVLKNSVLRSTTPITSAATALQYSFNDYVSAPTGSGLSDQGGNITTDPLLWGIVGGAAYDFHITSTSSPVYRTGTFVAYVLDMAGRERANPPTMGAYEFASPRTAASVRTAASTRTAALVRAPRFYP